MSVISTLYGVNRLSSIVNKSYIFNFFRTKQYNVIKQATRNMSDHGPRLFHITPTRYHYTKFKDDLHFYVTIGVIPLGLLILYCNIFIGPATLTEIPEGYEPKHWEYYKHPIKRFISKHFETDIQVTYEIAMHSLYEENERNEWRAKIDKVKDLMLERDDYKGIYFIPSDQGRHYRKMRRIVDELDESRGFK